MAESEGLPALWDVPLTLCFCHKVAPTGLRQSCEEELQILPAGHKITAKVADERGAQEV